MVPHKAHLCPMLHPVGAEDGQNWSAFCRKLAVQDRRGRLDSLLLGPEVVE